MKALRITLLISIIVFSNSKLFAQKEEKQIIEMVGFKTDKIILNNKPAFNYTRIEDDFTILNLENKELIKGHITPIGDGKFYSIITFLASGKQFSNKKIIGRNELIFALAEYNAINADFTINESKISSFIENYNELK